MDYEKLLKDIRKGNRNSSYFKNQPNRENTVAFCKYYLHRGAMSEAMVREHECLRKQCPYLKKIDHKYWDKKARINASKKMKKAVTSGDAERIADALCSLIFGDISCGDTT